MDTKPDSSGRRKRLFLIGLSLATLLIGISVFFVAWMRESFRTEVRWFVSSGYYKTQVLQQKNPSPGESQHIEWDRWGWAGQDTTVFLVYDPTDSLSVAAQAGRPGKYAGLPCEVFSVRRL